LSMNTVYGAPDGTKTNGKSEAIKALVTAKKDCTASAKLPPGKHTKDERTTALTAKKACLTTFKDGVKSLKKPSAE